MATTINWLIFLICIAGRGFSTVAAVETRTFCKSTTECGDYNITCPAGVIAIHTVVIDVNEICSTGKDTHECCCKNDLKNENQFLGETALNDAKRLCESKPSCYLSSYINKVHGMVTVKYDCQDSLSEITITAKRKTPTVVLSTSSAIAVSPIAAIRSSPATTSTLTSNAVTPQATYHKTGRSMDGSTPDGIATASMAPGSITTDESAAHTSTTPSTSKSNTSNDKTTASNATFMPPEMGDLISTIALSTPNSSAANSITGTFKFPMQEGAIVLGVFALLVLVAVLGATVINRHRRLQDDEMCIGPDNTYTEDISPYSWVNADNYEEISDVITFRNYDVITEPHPNVYSHVRRKDYDTVELDRRARVETDGTYDHACHYGNQRNQQIHHVTNRAYISTQEDTSYETAESIHGGNAQFELSFQDAASGYSTVQKQY